MSIWYPGSGMTYSQYLQANSFVLDMTSQVKFSSTALDARVSDQTQTLVASNEQLAKQFGSGFDSINSTLEWGFNRLEDVLHDINVSIDSLHADFNYNMGLLLEAASTTNRLLTSLLSRLDAVHRTLESPMLTQAREFYRIGCERLSKGLLDKALEAFIEAEKKNDTDFFTQFNLGKLYLYGIDDDDNVLDLHKAKTHLLLASRYARAEVTIDATFANFAAEALLHASIAAYAQSGEPNILEDPYRTKQLIDEARRLASDAFRLYPQLLEASYHHAKYCALLGEPTTAITSLHTAITADRGYAVKVDVDHAFDSVRPHVEALRSRLHDEKMVESRQLLQCAEQLFAEVLPWHLDKSTLADNYYKCHNDLSRSREHLSSETYFGFLDAINLLNPLLVALRQLRTKRIEELRSHVEQSVQTAKDTISLLRGLYSAAVENAIQEASGLLDQAYQHLGTETYEAFASALSLAEAANAKTRSAAERAREEDDSDARRMRRNDASRGYALTWGFLGMALGAVVLGATGCFSCLNNYSAQNVLVTDFNLFNGLFYGAIIGAVVGSVLGLLYGQTTD